MLPAPIIWIVWIWAAVSIGWALRPLERPPRVVVVHLEQTEAAPDPPGDGPVWLALK